MKSCNAASHTKVLLYSFCTLSCPLIDPFFLSDVYTCVQEILFSIVRLRSTCIVSYKLTAYLRGIDLPKCCPTSSEYQRIFFWPNRYTELPDGPWPKAHRRRTSVPRSPAPIPSRKHENSFLERLREKVTRIQDLAGLDLVAHISRHAILGQPLQVSLSFSIGDGMPESPAPRLESVRYNLHAITRVCGESNDSKRHVKSHVALDRHVENLDTSFPVADHLVNLHTTSPAITPVDSCWLPPNRTGETNGPFRPTFESELIARTYTLSLYLKVNCHGKSQTMRFDGGETVLLSPTLDASVRKGSSTERGEDGIADARGMPRVVQN